MERRYPKIGKFALLISISQFAGVLLNGLLGVFPAGFIGTGVRGEKFHLYQFLRQQMDLPYKSNGFWSDAGILTGQEYAMILLMVATLIIAILGLRQRPTIEGPKTLSSDEQRAQLESGQVSVSRPGGLSVVNPTTAAIVSSIVGGDETPTSDVIANALGEMSVVAQEMGVDEFLIKGEIIQEEVDDSTVDSRFTTSIHEEEDVVDLTGTISTPTVEATTTQDILTGIVVDSTEEVIEDDSEEDLDWLNESPLAEKMATINLPRLPTEPAVTTSAIVEVSQDVPAASDSPPTTDVPPATRSGFSGRITTKPRGLPEKAEYDMDLNQWTLFGKPIEFTDTPPPAPASAQPAAPQETSTKPAAKPPALPSLSKGESDAKYLRLPKVPQL